MKSLVSVLSGVHIDALTAHSATAKVVLSHIINEVREVNRHTEKMCLYLTDRHQ